MRWPWTRRREVRDWSEMGMPVSPLAKYLAERPVWPGLSKDEWVKRVEQADDEIDYVEALLHERKVRARGAMVCQNTISLDDAAAVAAEYVENLNWQHAMGEHDVERAGAHLDCPGCQPIEVDAPKITSIGTMIDGHVHVHYGGDGIEPRTECVNGQCHEYSIQRELELSPEELLREHRGW